MGNNGKHGHFHDGYPTNMTTNRIYTNQFIPAFDCAIIPASSVKAYFQSGFALTPVPMAGTV